MEGFMKSLLKKTIIITISSIIFSFNINLVSFSTVRMPSESYISIQETDISPCCILEEP